MLSEATEARAPTPMPGVSFDDGAREILRRLEALEGKVAATSTEDRLSMVVFSGSLDKMLAAFVLASAAAASGMQVEMFFTFWGLAALRDKGVLTETEFAAEKQRILGS